MKEPQYFTIYEDFFKDAKNFLNTVIETKSNIFDVSSSSESSSDDKKDSEVNNSEKERHIDFYLNEHSNKVLWQKSISHDENSNGDIVIGRNTTRRNDKFRSETRAVDRYSEMEVNKNIYNPLSNVNNEGTKILLCYQNSHTMCLSYKFYNENVYQDSTNVNYSISIFKKKVPNFDIEDEKYAFERDNKNKITHFLKRLIFFWSYKENGGKFLFTKEERKQMRDEDNIRNKYHKEDEENKNGGKNMNINKNFISNGYSSNSLSMRNGKVQSMEEEKKENIDFKEMKRKRKKERKKGISYEHLLVPSNHKYDAFCLFNPRFKQGKHHTVMCLQGYNVSIIPFVKPRKLKEEVNELFNEINPWIHKSLTLSKLRNLKIDLFNLIHNIPEIDISTISCAWVFFERLVIKGYVHKTNRKLYAATCLILSIKFHQHDDMQNLEKLLIHIQKLDKKENLTPSLIFSVEFLVYRLLDFSLQHTYEDIRPHIHQYLESKELKFEDVYGISEEAYLCSNYSNVQ
ncbi:cyclin dependent kinase binding protein [Plasmodium gonderi]|uniref:Cyclin dependent kinase binding protein n=1 Tax=Plasmodium gonderi TaxID=77519 RepID=A0A1Y1JKI4_PLAGO|nr:cyclin dependent kinase binding protein [Plasmodium gonderi]GAW81965.1 cyclin dependent kinase binding protein [Plasmodium gonderi]